MVGRGNGWRACLLAVELADEDPDSYLSDNIVSTRRLRQNRQRSALPSISRQRSRRRSQAPCAETGLPASPWLPFPALRRCRVHPWWLAALPARLPVAPALLRSPAPAPQSARRSEVPPFPSASP